MIPSGDDRDFLYRAVKRGYAIVMTSEPEVIHYGFRSWAEDGKDHGRRNSVGVVVPYIKYMRQGDPAALVHFAGDFLGDALTAAGRLTRGRRPYGLNRLRYFVRGAMAVARYPVNPETMLFMPPEKGMGQ